MEKAFNEFVIDGKQYILSAGGDIENLNRVVAYINKKVSRGKETEKIFVPLIMKKKTGT